jgi:FeS assembly SUF system regulator
MLRLTNLADYAVVVMTAAARCPDGSLSAGAVAVRTGIPAPTVAKVMGLLKRGGLLASSRGVCGGFRLALAPAAISVADIVEAVDGPIALTNCQHGPDSDHLSACALEGSCAVRPHWRPINLAVRAALAAVTLADLAGPVRANILEGVA